MFHLEAKKFSEADEKGNKKAFPTFHRLASQNTFDCQTACSSLAIQYLHQREKSLIFQAREKHTNHQQSIFIDFIPPKPFANTDKTCSVMKFNSYSRISTRHFMVETFESKPKSRALTTFRTLFINFTHLPFTYAPVH